MSDFQGTWSQELIKNLILSFSGLGFGFAAYLVVWRVRKALHLKGTLRRLQLAYAAATAGYVIIVGLLAEAIYLSGRPLPIEWRVLLYTAAIILSAVGYAGIVWESRKAEKTGRYL